MLRRRKRKLLRKSLKLMRRRKGMPTRRKEEQQGRGEKVRAEEETKGDLDWKRSFSCELEFVNRGYGFTEDTDPPDPVKVHRWS